MLAGVAIVMKKMPKCRRDSTSEFEVTHWMRSICDWVKEFLGNSRSPSLSLEKPCLLYGCFAVWRCMEIERGMEIFPEQSLYLREAEDPWKQM